MRLATDLIADWCGGVVDGPAAVVDGATQDSRTIRPGQLFVPLVADRDGHDFIDGALARGAAAYLTQREPVGGTAVVVANTAVALESIARRARSTLAIPVVGITGSVGKTSTKDLLGAVLATTRRTAVSERSFNNEIGVPLTVLNAPDDVEVLVVEMGARGPGHIASLCSIAQPTIGVVTTVAAAHTSEFGSVEAISKAQGELIEALPADGLAVLNADVDSVATMASRTDAEVVTFGRAEHADVRIVEAEVDDELRLRVTLETRWGRLELRPTVRGVHLAPNVAAAAAVALGVGIDRESVGVGLEHADVSPWRMEVGRSPEGAVIVNDAYNANPTSMRGALESLAAVPAGRRVAVLGYMAELDDEGAEHRAVAEYAGELGIELLAVGTDLYGVAPAADARAALGRLDGDTAVLVKGSRVAGLETFAAELAG